MLRIEEHYLRQAWQKALLAILDTGKMADPRGLATLEVPNLWITIREPQYRVGTLDQQQLPVIIAKQICMLRSSYESEFVVRYCSQSSGFSAPAAMVFDDLDNEYVYRHIMEAARILREDEGTRRAVIPVYGGPRASKRVPIVLAVQLLLREGRLDCLAFIRSNDIWNGFIPDVHMIGFIQDMIAGWNGFAVGFYHHVIASAHIYMRDLDNIKAALGDKPIIVPAEEKVPRFSAREDETKLLAERIIKMFRDKSTERDTGDHMDGIEDEYLCWAVKILKAASC